MTFRGWFYKIGPQNIGGQFGTPLDFLRKSPEIYFGPKGFRTIFEKRTPVYSLAAPLSSLAKSIHYKRCYWPCTQIPDRLLTIQKP